VYLNREIAVTVDRTESVEVTYMRGGDYVITVQDRQGNYQLVVNLSGETLAELSAGIAAAQHHRLTAALGATA
jgi:hypothetical protein